METIRVTARIDGGKIIINSNKSRANLVCPGCWLERNGKCTEFNLEGDLYKATVTTEALTLGKDEANRVLGTGNCGAEVK